jgi:GGDEF domain-containing protein
LNRLVASFGVTAFPQAGPTAEDLLDTAQSALHRAQREAGDRISIAEAAS